MLIYPLTCDDAFERMTPAKVVPNVDVPIEDVVYGDNQQIRRHQKVGQGEILDVERMHSVRLTKQHPSNENLSAQGEGTRIESRQDCPS